jgi:hypothetical protein
MYSLGLQGGVKMLNWGDTETYERKRMNVRQREADIGKGKCKELRIDSYR